jgi:restriction system protein
MKLRMAKNSLFAILLRSPWWASAALAAAIALVAAALLPPDMRVVGALTGFPFIVIAAMAAWRQRQLPSAARIEEVRTAVSTMAWPAFSRLLEAAFTRDGYQVQRPSGSAGVDFTLERQGRRMHVSARRWKSAQTGVETLRALQAARAAAEEDLVNDALVIGLGPLTDSARDFAAAKRIAVWQAAEVAQALRGMSLGAPQP